MESMVEKKTWKDLHDHVKDAKRLQSKLTHMVIVAPLHSLDVALFVYSMFTCSLKCLHSVMTYSKSLTLGFAQNQQIVSRL